MNQKEIKSIQAEAFLLFKDFDKACRTNHLRYYMIGGTMLGAVRHRGFIPWDDDIDVGMPRPDYERFISEIELPNGIKKWNTNTSNECYIEFTKLKKPISNESVPSIKEVFIDLFPLDGCPKSDQKGIHSYWAKFNFIRTMKNGHAMTLEGKPLYKKMGVLLLRSIPKRTYHSIMKRYLLRNSFDESCAVGNFSGHWEDKEIMEKSVYGTPKLAYFEDDEYYGVELPHEYLSNMYGDYMTPPTEDQIEMHYS